MKFYEILLALVASALIYKRVEGYIGYAYTGEQRANNYNIPGRRRPTEFFLNQSINDWAPRSPGYVFDPTVEMDV
jgi:hypothetical protein